MPAAIKWTVEVFGERWTPEPNSGCWLWTKALTKEGYGSLGFNRKINYAHRVSWILHRGEIPPGLCVLHHCDTRACVNPDHLFLGTYQDNFHDCRAKGRIVVCAAFPAFKSKLNKETNYVV